MLAPAACGCLAALNRLFRYVQLIAGNTGAVYAQS